MLLGIDVGTGSAKALLLDMHWQQLLADVLKRLLYTMPIAAASARGATLLAGIGIGVYVDAQATLPLTAKPTLTATPNGFDLALEQAWTRYQSLYPQLKKTTAEN